jgi:hypothetical protein
MLDHGVLCAVLRLLCCANVFSRRQVLLLVHKQPAASMLSVVSTLIHTHSKRHTDPPLSVSWDS